MTLTRLEKIAFLSCFCMLVAAIATVGIKKTAQTKHNLVIAETINRIARLTDKTPLQKSLENIAEEQHSEAGKLNVNFLSVAQLNALPKVGKTTAERIASFIKERGGINNMQELLEVKGISRAKLRFLSRYLTARGGNRDPQSIGGSGKLNLNFADVKAIQTLPGIGKKMAEQIVDFRNKNGGIFSLEDLMEVPGMTKAKLARFRDQIEFR